MRKLNRFLIGSAVALVFTSLAWAGNQEPLASPKAKANQIKVLSGETAETLDRSLGSGSPQAQAFAASVRTAPGKTADQLDRSRAWMPKIREQLGSRAQKSEGGPVK